MTEPKPSKPYKALYYEQKQEIARLREKVAQHAAQICALLNAQGTAKFEPTAFGDVVCVKTGVVNLESGGGCAALQESSVQDAGDD